MRMGVDESCDLWWMVAKGEGSHISTEELLDDEPSIKASINPSILQA